MTSLAAIVGACLFGVTVVPAVTPARKPPPSLAELPDPLPFASAVKDPAFAILIGLLDSESYGLLTAEHLERALRRLGSATRLPYQKLAWVSRRSIEPRRVSEITLEFVGPVKVPIPYSILGYHPGDIRASSTWRLREWTLGDLTLGPRALPFADVRLLAVEEGDMVVDIDAFVDFLAGPALDDTRVTGLAVLRHEGRRLGVAFGYNDDARARYGVFDFAADRVLIPLPSALSGVPADLRRRAEAREGWLPATSPATAGP